MILLNLLVESIFFKVINTRSEVSDKIKAVGQNIYYV